jgi:hypothetical protein
VVVVAAEVSCRAWQEAPPVPLQICRQADEQGDEKGPVRFQTFGNS